MSEVFVPIGPPESKAQLLEQQGVGLSRLLRHVFEHSKFYRNYYNDHGISIQDIDELSLEDLPTINKSMLMDHFDDLVCDPAIRKVEIHEFLEDPKTVGKLFKDRYRVFHTSGSTGQLGIFVNGPREIEFFRFARRNYHIDEAKRRNLPDRIRIAGYFAVDGHFSGATKLRDFPESIYEVRLFSIKDPIEKTIQELNEFQPMALGSYPSTLNRLAVQQLQGNLKLKLYEIYCSGEVLNEAVRENSKAAFGINPLNIYACTESLHMASYCTEKQIHLTANWNLFEVLDEQLKAVPAGVEGRLYLTNLYNYTQPLIRYDMNDRLILSNQTCKCGSCFPQVQQISGRQAELLYYQNNKGETQLFHPFNMAMFCVPGLIKIQMVQQSETHFLLKLVLSDPNQKEAAIKQMYKFLEENNMDQSVGFEIQLVEDIPSDPESGKYRLVLPLKQASHKLSVHP